MILALDSNYLAYQALYTVGDLEHDGMATGIVFGVLSRAMNLGHKFRTNRMAFCWDSRHSLRKVIFPAYKAHRSIAAKSPAEQEKFRVFFEQVDRLKAEVLPSIGFASVFEQKGIEADDLLCSLSIERDEHDMTIVTADADIFQCLKFGVSIYNPSSKKLWTNRSFEDEYGITPEAWIEVKAIAGCPGDGVPGVKGVGEKTVIKWMHGKMDPKSVKAKAIDDFIVSGAKGLNEKLVRLPFPATNPVEMREDHLSLEALIDVAEKFGLASFLEDDQLKRWEDFFAGNFSDQSDGGAVGRSIRNRTIAGIVGRKTERMRR